MPLTLAKTTEQNRIRKIGGSDEVKRFLANLGFTVGEEVTVISKLNDNVIVKIKEARIAISAEMAGKILV